MSKNVSYYSHIKLAELITKVLRSSVQECFRHKNNAKISSGFLIGCLSVTELKPGNILTINFFFLISVCVWYKAWFSTKKWKTFLENISHKRT